MKKTKPVLIVIVAIFFASTFEVYSQTNDKDSLRTMAVQILKLVNDHRRETSLGELKFNDAINSEAQKHSQNMANGVVPFSHDGFDARADRLMKLIGGNAIAENIANGQDDAKSAVESWLGSTGHRKNIEGNYRLTGIGIARGKDGNLYFTQIFLLTQP